MLTGNICFVLARQFLKNAIYNSFAKVGGKKSTNSHSFLFLFLKKFAVLSFQTFLADRKIMIHSLQGQWSRFLTFWASTYGEDNSHYAYWIIPDEIIVFLGATFPSSPPSSSCAISPRRGKNRHNDTECLLFKRRDDKIHHQLYKIWAPHLPVSKFFLLSILISVNWLSLK